MTFLLERFPNLDLEHASLGLFPTPIEPIVDMVEGASLWCKREDLSGEMYGGNKVRKLEWLLPEARLRGDTVMSLGATGSNHLLATALHGESVGLNLQALVVPQPVTEHVRDNARILQHHAARVWPCRSRMVVPWVGWQAWKHCRDVCQGEPTWIPAGGSSALGTLGWVEAGLEIADQVEQGCLPLPTDVFVPFGSGGTAAGLWVGLSLAGLPTRVHAVRVMDWPYVRRATLTSLAGATVRLLRARGAVLAHPGADTLIVDSTAIGGGYGHPTSEGMEAVEKAREVAGLLLEPTYSAKALAACIRAIVEGRTGGEVLFVDTLNSRSLTGLLEACPPLSGESMGGLLA
ncbi:MAG: pyridoxal-phosphate dependent enzyme [Myxococcota bacterium]|nr:pyridoxal-phosphate dependent enzyme [Myxococcota bacterium]